MHYIGLLAGYLEYGLNKIAASVNNEVDIVREFVDFVSSDVAVKFNRISKNKYLSIKTRFVHQKPYAIFVNPQKICGKTRVELGDILFVVKHQRDGALIDHRGSFSQAKLYKSGWEIKAHQFEFLHNIRNITFRFGNKVYQDLKIQPINWDISSRSKWFSNFLLLSNIFSLSFPPNYFVNFYNRKCNNFYVNYWMSERSYRNLIQYYPRWSFRNFVSNQIFKVFLF